MAVAYTFRRKDIRTYLNNLYTDGLKRSSYLIDADIEEIVSNIGIFKLKGYAYAFKNQYTQKSIDDILMLYFFDKYLTTNLMDLTFEIETKLKTKLIEICYRRISNPFFYLIQSNHKNHRFFINKETGGNWKSFRTQSANESYNHYGIYYRRKYDFTLNSNRYLNNETLINQVRSDINYPAFHYLIESATLGVVIHFIKSLKIGNFDILNAIAREFNVPTQNFEPYIERLNEIRNRTAHRERIFNRTYRSVTGVSGTSYHRLRSNINNHKTLDVYMFLLSLTNKLNYLTYQDFEKDMMNRVFREFKKDFYIRQESKFLNRNIKRKEFENMKRFIVNCMK